MLSLASKEECTIDRETAHNNVEELSTRVDKNKDRIKKII